MANLVARGPADGLLPVRFGELALEAADPVPMTWVSPYTGRAEAVSAALEAALGLAFPAPGAMTGVGAVRAVWVGPGQALILGAAVGADVGSAGAAVVDQSDGWCHLVLGGAEIPEVLARLTSVDVRPGVFPVGAATQTLLFHMTATLMRVGEARWEVLVFRSMAATAVHDLSRAMRMVAARA